MAIVQCPYCGKNVSSKSAECPHCGANLAAMSEQDLQRLNRDRRHAKGMRLQNEAMMAIVLFLSSFVYYYFWQPEVDSWQMMMTYAVMGLGFIWYIVTKARIVMFKRG